MKVKETEEEEYSAQERRDSQVISRTRSAEEIIRREERGR